MRAGRRAFSLAILSLAVGVVIGVPESLAKPRGVPSDFNCDGFADLAVGARTETVGDQQSAGVVQIFWGSADGPTRESSFLHQPPSLGGTEWGDKFGSSLAFGDFDGDGCDDLAVGSPGEQIGDAPWSGAVTAYYGSPTRPLSRGEGLDPRLLGLAPSPKGGLGNSLTVGDFNADGYGDLAVGGPTWRGQSSYRAGIVLVIYGSRDGLLFANASSEDRVQTWPQEFESVDRDDQRFGDALAAGDFDADGFDDLAVGMSGYSVPTGLGESVNRIVGTRTGLEDGIWLAGAVAIYYGSREGLAEERARRFDQDTPGVKGKAEGVEAGGHADRMGATLAVGDFDGDGHDDLAVGIPEEMIGPDKDEDEVNPGHGAVAVLYGSESGISVRDQLWHQASPGIRGTPEGDDIFGSALAAGDFDGDGRADLAIGASGETLPRRGGQAHGVVHVLLGGRSGLTGAGSLVLHQDIAGVRGRAESRDRFGKSLVAGNYGRGRVTDLVIGIPGERINGVYKAGAVAVHFGSMEGLLVRGNLLFGQWSPGVRGVAEEKDRFGWVGPTFRNEGGGRTK